MNLFVSRSGAFLRHNNRKRDLSHGNVQESEPTAIKTTDRTKWQKVIADDSNEFFWNENTFVQLPVRNEFHDQSISTRIVHI